MGRELLAKALPNNMALLDVNLLGNNPSQAQHAAIQAQAQMALAQAQAFAQQAAATAAATGTAAAQQAAQHAAGVAAAAAAAMPPMGGPPPLPNEFMLYENIVDTYLNRNNMFAELLILLRSCVAAG